MANLSPATTFKENMVTNIIKSLPTSIGGTVGKFAWGPAYEIVPIGTEGDLLTYFNEPNSFNADDWFSARNFLDYSGSLKVVRVVDSTAKNAYSFAAGSALNCLVLNRADWALKNTVPDVVSAGVLAKFPGSLGNSIEFSIADSSTFENWKYRNIFSSSTTKYSTTVTISSTFSGTALLGSNTLTGVSLTAGKFVVGQVLTETATAEFPIGTSIIAIVNSTTLLLSNNATLSGTTAATASITNSVTNIPGAPSTTRFVAAQGGSNDEIHAVVVDSDGGITGTAGTVLETFRGLSKAIDSLDENNLSNYYQTYINNNSNWVWVSALPQTRATVSSYNYSTLTGANTVAGSSEISFTGNTGTLMMYDPVIFNGTTLGYVVGVTPTKVTLNTTIATTNTGVTLQYGTDVPRPFVTGTINSIVTRGTATLGATPIVVGATSVIFAAGVSALAVGTALYSATGSLIGTLTAAVTAGQTTAAPITPALISALAPAPLVTSLFSFTSTTMAAGKLVNGITVSGAGFAGPASVVYSSINLAGTSTITTLVPSTAANVGTYKVTYGNGYYPVGSVASSKFGSFSQQIVYDMENGVDGYSGVLSDFMTAWDVFKDPAQVDVNYLILGSALDGANDGELARYVIENIAEKRRDCIAFHSPKLSDVTNVTPNAALANIIAYRQKFNNTTYAMMDTGWKYQYDRFNDTYRWVPLNADIAGLSAQVDRTNDPWWSFGGYNRGLIKNVVKLAFNPTNQETQRDVLYPLGINPVVTEANEGTLILGDTMMTSASTLFSQVGVRKMFMLVEKAISKLAKRNLFEFNDTITQTRFYNSTTKYLSDIKGRRGITDYKVICDSSVNTPLVVEAKRFVGKIYIKPNMSINWAELEFTAVGASVAFSELG